MKTHFANSAEPFKEGTDIKAMCGTGVSRAAFKVSLDFDWLAKSEAPDFTGNFVRVSCYRCNRMISQFKDRYVYVVCDGQESMTPETVESC